MLLEMGPKRHGFPKKRSSVCKAVMKERIYVVEASRLNRYALQRNNCPLSLCPVGFRGDGRKPAAGAWLEVCPAAGSHSCLR